MYGKKIEKKNHFKNSYMVSVFDKKYEVNINSSFKY